MTVTASSLTMNSVLGKVNAFDHQPRHGVKGSQMFL